jgi:hypothetical protein
MARFVPTLAVLLDSILRGDDMPRPWELVREQKFIQLRLCSKLLTWTQSKKRSINENLRILSGNPPPRIFCGEPDCGNQPICNGCGHPAKCSEMDVLEQNEVEELLCRVCRKSKENITLGDASRLEKRARHNLNRDARFGIISKENIPDLLDEIMKNDLLPHAIWQVVKSLAGKAHSTYTTVQTGVKFLLEHYRFLRLTMLYSHHLENYQW